MFINNLNEAQGAREISGISAGAETQPNRRALGWQQQDTLSSYAQDKVTSPSWSQAIGDWFFGNRTKPMEIVEVEDTSSNSQVTAASPSATARVSEVSDTQQQDAVRIKSKFDALMDRLHKDCPNMDMDEFLEFLFYLDHESKKEELETQKDALKEKHVALKKHREEYKRLADDLAQDLKRTFGWEWGQETSTVLCAAFAAAGLGSGWVVPVMCLAAGKVLSSYYDNAIEHAVARVIAKIGVVNEQATYNLVKGGLDALFLLGAVLGGGAEPSQLYKALQKLASFAQVATTLGKEITGYQSEKRKGNVQFVSTEIQEGEKAVERATQDIVNCNKRSSHMSSSLGEWARNLDNQIKALSMSR